MDFVCCLGKLKGKTTAKYVKNIIKEILCKSEVYKERLQNREWDKCWTLEYAEVNGIGFNIDIVPGVSESDDVVQSMINLGVSREKAELAVAIIDKRGRYEHPNLWQ